MPAQPPKVIIIRKEAIFPASGYLMASSRQCSSTRDWLLTPLLAVKSFTPFKKVRRRPLLDRRRQGHGKKSPRREGPGGGGRSIGLAFRRRRARGAKRSDQGGAVDRGNDSKVGGIEVARVNTDEQDGVFTTEADRRAAFGVGDGELIDRLQARSVHVGFDEDLVARVGRIEVEHIVDAAAILE